MIGLAMMVVILTGGLNLSLGALGVSAAMFGDWLSYWCAILHKTDPNPVFKIDHLKNKLESL